MAEKGLIAILDALGTRGSWLRSNPERTVESLTYISDELTESKSLIEKLEGKYEKNLKVTSYSFSDTIIVVFTGDNNESVILDAAVLTGLVIINGIEKGIYYRGAMSFGDFYRKKEEKYSFIIGPAVDEAAEWYDKADIIGVYASPSSKFILDKHELTKKFAVKRTRYLEYEIPMKGNKKYKTWTLNWPFAVAYALGNYKAGKDERESLINRYAELNQNKKWLLERFSTAPIGLNDSEKFTNTIDFYDYVTAKYKERSQK